MILRNPIDRALSAYRMLYNRKDLNLSFSESVKNFISINKDKALFQDYETTNFLEAGLYSLMVEEYMKYFPKENIFIGFTEDLDSQPERFMNNLYDFLSIDTFQNKLIGKKYHEGGVLKSSNLQRFLEYISHTDLKIIRLLKKIFPELDTG